MNGTILLNSPLGVATSEVQLLGAVVFLAEATHPREALLFTCVLMFGVLGAGEGTS